MKEYAFHIVDTTLRDGEQSPGLALSSRDKMILAQRLDALGVYEIEGGIPAMGTLEQEAVKGMSLLCRRARIAAWNRLSLQDIEASIACSPDIVHISVPVSDLQIQKKLQKDRDWIERSVRECIAYARERGYAVTAGFEDASRADMQFMIRLGRQLKEQGVSYLRFADTVGILTPQETYDKIKTLRDASAMDIEFHAHNDLGMAVANSIAAVQAGARYIDTTLGGVGERAGNCSLAEFLEAVSLEYEIPFRIEAVQETAALASKLFGLQDGKDVSL